MKENKIRYKIKQNKLVLLQLKGVFKVLLKETAGMANLILANGRLTFVTSLRWCHKSAFKVISESNK